MSLNPETLLRNPHRARILAEVTAHPGLCFRELSRRTALASGTIAHHLSKLSRAKLVWMVNHGPRRLHFPGSRPADDRIHALLAQHALPELDRGILAFLRSVGSARQTEVLDSPLGATVPRSTMQHTLGRMHARGFIRETRVGRRVVYEALA